jgi:RNA polymerase sigma-70 factor, ECF subfamily
MSASVDTMTESAAYASEVETLLGRCALRDSKALNQLYQLVAPRLFGVLLKLLRRRALAEEALQDVIVKVWQRAGQFEAYRGRGMAWLVSIARNRAIDMLRSQRNYVSIDEAAPADLADDSANDAMEMSGTDKMRTALNRCLGGLSDQQRECITLAYVKGYSHDEIARSVGSPLGTVKSWVRRGLSSLKRCLDS